MKNLHIIYIDDQIEVLGAIGKDLEVFEKYISLEECQSASEAWDLINKIDKKGNKIAVIICDHVMPNKTGVEFLSEINSDIRFSNTKKVLLTGQATHSDTIVAINNASIDKYIEKPWKSDLLTSEIKTLFTKYVFDEGIDYEQYKEVLDPWVIINLIK